LVRCQVAQAKEEDFKVFAIVAKEQEKQETKWIARS
jgi:hypothetical protein